jgi:hypothetical protein
MVGITVTDLHLQAICASPTGAVAAAAKLRVSAYDADRRQAVERISCDRADGGRESGCLV